ncbi:MAG: prepilin-type N-terminal cleavage/methylation domain-containing protein [Phycisphaerae bacterium]
MTSNKGFTLVEILIVVIILGILAAIVIPQFSSASQDARESSLTSDLQTLRSQLELYNIQHNDHYPNVKSADSGATWVADANFAVKLTSQTDQYGNIVANGTAGAFGPYMQSFPTNAISGRTTVRVAGAAAGAGTDAWHFDPNSGRLSADNTGNNSAGVAFSGL